jgi:hypothetical protein
MRSLVELQALSDKHGTDSTGLRREDLMDALREKTGSFDPDVQIDPAKAADLKREIDWAADDYGLSKDLNSAYAVEPKLDGARMRIQRRGLVVAAWAKRTVIVVALMAMVAG